MESMSYPYHRDRRHLDPGGSNRTAESILPLRLGPSCAQHYSIFFASVAGPSALPFAPHALDTAAGSFTQYPGCCVLGKPYLLR
jgi:hypothetical protein